MKKVVVIGPESTGKSTLCQQLALHYNSGWCTEYAREYLLQHGMNYSYDDLLTIAQQQLILEDTCCNTNGQSSSAQAKKITGKGEVNVPLFAKPPLFIDTNMLVMQVWCEFVFNRCHHFILDQIIHRQYHLYLLCDTDLPWVKDELREYPDQETRQTLYRMYKEILINQSVPWANISGTDSQRLQSAVDAVDRFIF